jgi:hypothetical protein
LTELEERGVGSILEYTPSSYDEFLLASIHPLCSSSPILQFAGSLFIFSAATAPYPFVQL